MTINIPKGLKPMLAAKDASRLQFPLCASPKVDGIRALVVDGVVLSRTLKPIPNPGVQALFGDHRFNGLDGELVVGAPNAPNCMQATTSGVMSRDGSPDVTFYIFDAWHVPEEPYKIRETFVRRWHDCCWGRVKQLEQKLVLSQAELDAYEVKCLAAGYEGVMVRDPHAKYKYGRATARGGELVKIKRFEDDEAVVVGFEERMHNENETTIDNLGHTKRSTHKAGKTPAGDLGALVCVSLEHYPDWYVGHPSEFSIGTGFTAEQRCEMWARRDELTDKVVKFKHFAATGVVDVPRFPVFLGFRDTIDTGEAK
jgi:DNA ligase-1